MVEADRCSLFLVDHERGELWTKVAQGLGDEGDPHPHGPRHRRRGGETDKAINIPDAYKDPRFNQNVDKQTGYRTRTILCVPMRSLEGEVVGVLQALNKLDGKPFNAEDEELLSALGGQAAARSTTRCCTTRSSSSSKASSRQRGGHRVARSTTAGHSGRVARLSVGLGDMLPRAGRRRPLEGRVAHPQERQELRYAALLHDFGKVGVRENVLVKANKLEPLELENLRGRFETIFVQEELQAERRRWSCSCARRRRGAPAHRRDRPRWRRAGASSPACSSSSSPATAHHPAGRHLRPAARDRQASYVGPFSAEKRPYLPRTR